MSSKSGMQVQDYELADALALTGTRASHAVDPPLHRPYEPRLE